MRSRRLAVVQALIEHSEAMALIPASNDHADADLGFKSAFSRCEQRVELLTLHTRGRRFILRQDHTTSSEKQRVQCWLEKGLEKKLRTMVPM